MRVLAFPLVFLLPGCFLMGGNRTVDAPPRDAETLAIWWKETIEKTDPALLKVWYDASERHRQRGSSATYVSSMYVGHNMVGPYYYEQHFPTPIPEVYLPMVRDRLMKESLTNESRFQLFSARHPKRCSREEAQKTWDSAWERQFKASPAR